MATAAAARSSSSRAAATETRVCAPFEALSIQMKKIDDQHSPCTVRLHGPVAVFHESRKIGDTRSRSEHDEDWPDFWNFDHRISVPDSSLLRSHVACCDLIHRMLADAQCTGQYDLADHNWEGFRPRDIATTIVAMVRRDAQGRSGGLVPAYAFDVEMPITVRLIYSEPKALLLACKEAAGAETTNARAPARGRKRRRGDLSAGEMCAICLVDFQEIQEEETVRLPCSHAFHGRCILPWFHRVSTCPTCRRDAAIRHDPVFHEAAAAVETGNGNDNTPPIQVNRPVRAPRQPARLAD